MHYRRTAPHPYPLPIGWGEGEWLAATRCRATRGLISKDNRLGLQQTVSVVQVCFGMRNSVASPTTAETMPPMSIQTALSVGEPVKNLETSELNEFVALTPTTMRTMPPASRAREIILFIMVCE